MGRAGTYWINQDPDWMPQPSTDTSGDRHVHSLNWALPLLYHGVTAKNRTAVARFTELIHTWIDDHSGTRQPWVDRSLYIGLRAQTLACAADTLDDQAIIDAAMRDASTILSTTYDTTTAAVGSNNTALIQQIGALAVTCEAGDLHHAQQAWQNLHVIAEGVVHADGSDVEGSPAYGSYLEKLIGDAERAGAQCGLPTERLAAVRERTYGFLAHATRPDGNLTPIGDSTASPVPARPTMTSPAAQWVSSRGETGTPPQETYATFAGGYTFGRATWEPDATAPDTHYSLRHSSSRPPTAHTHDDGGSLTVYAHTIPWITDRGPYRYQTGSTLRDYVTTRSAHSAVTITGAKRNPTGTVQLLTAQVAPNPAGTDTTCVLDTTYQGVTMTRCVQYARGVNAVIVTDRIHARTRSSKTARQRWMLNPGVTATSSSRTITLNQQGQQMSLIAIGPGGWKAELPTSRMTTGWHTTTWGTPTPAAALTRDISTRHGTNTTMVTVLIPQQAGQAVSAAPIPGGITVSRGTTSSTIPTPTAPVPAQRNR